MPLSMYTNYYAAHLLFILMFRSTNKCVFYYKMLHFLAYDAFSIDIYSGLCCHVLREKNRNSMCFFFYHQTRSPFDKYSEENKSILTK